MIIVKKPKIRFKDFTETWEQRKFSEGVSEIGDGLHGTPIYCEDGNVYFINGNNLVDGKIVISAETKKVNESQQSTADKSLDDITILMSINGTIGNLAYYSGERLMLGKSAAYIKVSEFDKRFVYAYLQAPSVQGYFMDSLTGTTIKNLGLKAIREMIMFIPQDVDEQKRIGKFFDYLDHLITLHQRKCENLKKLKKFMLQKLFPQNGENVPKIRFSNFTDTWEQRKLEEICESFEYGLNAAAKEYDGENKYIRITDIDDNSHEFIQDDVTSPDIDLTNSENYQLKYGDVLFTRTGASVGKTYIYKESDGLVYYAGFLIRGRVKSNYSPEFIFQNTLTDDYDKFIRITSQRSGQPGVNAQEYASYEISVPKFEEQQKIGAYFSTLDHLITLHQSKCDNLKELKKYMLQNMFI